MSSRLENSYKILGLSKGATFEEVHKARRKLAMKWHPDRYQNRREKREANRNFQQVNAAYAYIKKVKNRPVARPGTANNGKRPSSPRNHKSTKYTHTRKSTHRRNNRGNGGYRYRNTNRGSAQQTYGTTSETEATGQQKERNFTVHGTFKRSRLEEIFRRAQRRHLRRKLERRKNKKKARVNRRLKQEQKHWDRRYKAFKKRSRVGVYRSTINTLLFRSFEENSERGGSLGPVQTQNYKYNIEVRHNLIKDQIFYSINKGLNLFFKFCLGILFSLQFIYNIYDNFYYGFFLGTVSGFITSELMVLAQLSILLIPDNIYQRYLQWKFQNLESTRIRTTFKNRKLPAPYEHQFRMLRAAKFSFLALVVWLYYF